MNPAVKEIISTLLFLCSTVGISAPDIAWKTQCQSALVKKAKLSASPTWVWSVEDVKRSFEGRGRTAKMTHFTVEYSGVAQDGASYVAIVGQCEFPMSSPDAAKPNHRASPSDLGPMRKVTLKRAIPVKSPWIATAPLEMHSIHNGVGSTLDSLLSDTVNEGELTASVLTKKDNFLAACNVRKSSSTTGLLLFCRLDVRVVPNDGEPATISCNIRYSNSGRLDLYGANSYFIADAEDEQSCIELANDAD